MESQNAESQQVEAVAFVVPALQVHLTRHAGGPAPDRAAPRVMEKPDAAEALHLACRTAPELRDVEPAGLAYCLRRETVIPSDRVGGMARWRKTLFAAMLLNANRSASYYGLPLA